VGIIMALAIVTFGLVYYLNAPTSHTPSRASRAAAPESPKPLAVRKRKIAGVGKLHREKPAVTKGFSESEYRLLRRRYKPVVQTARGAVNAQGLKVIASGTRRLMLGESTPTGLKLGYALLPAAKDVIYGNTSALERKFAAGLSPNATMLMGGSGIDTHVTLLDLAIQTGQRSVIRLLISRGASVNPPHTNYQDGEPNRSEGPLALAARNDEDDVIRLLLEQGADVNQRMGEEGNNHTALAEAAILGNPSTVYLLLTHGANVNAVVEPDGSLPHALTFYPQPRLVAVRKLLVQYGLKIPAGH
jgi:ankyrin repeat protein